MDQIIIVFIPVKKNVSVLLKLIAVVKVRQSEYEQAKVADIFEYGPDWSKVADVGVKSIRYKIAKNNS